MSSEEIQAPLQMDRDECAPAPRSKVAGRRGSSRRRARVPAAREADRSIVPPFLPPRGEVAAGLVGTTAAVLDSRSVATEHFRILATRLKMKLPPDRPACIGVVSAAAGEGKTTVSIGLAHAFTRTVATRVALLDLDLRVVGP